LQKLGRLAMPMQSRLDRPEADYVNLHVRLTQHMHPRVTQRSGTSYVLGLASRTKIWVSIKRKDGEIEGAI
jgi:hypothetical protein